MTIRLCFTARIGSNAGKENRRYRSGDALFAVCQSSEMLFLSLEERAELAKFVVKKTAGRIPVVTSGLTGAKMKDIIKEMLPFIFLFIGVLFLLTYVPELVLWLPKLSGYKP